MRHIRYDLPHLVLDLITFFSDWSLALNGGQSGAIREAEQKVVLFWRRLCGLWLLHCRADNFPRQIRYETDSPLPASKIITHFLFKLSIPSPYCRHSTSWRAPKSMCGMTCKKCWPSSQASSPPSCTWPTPAATKNSSASTSNKPVTQSRFMNLVFNLRYKIDEGLIALFERVSEQHVSDGPEHDRPANQHAKTAPHWRHRQRPWSNDELARDWIVAVELRHQRCLLERWARELADDQRLELARQSSTKGIAMRHRWHASKSDVKYLRQGRTSSRTNTAAN